MDAADATLEHLYRDGLTIAGIASLTGTRPRPRDGDSSQPASNSANPERCGSASPSRPFNTSATTSGSHPDDAQIARRYHVAPSTVTAWRNHYQLPQQPHSPPPKDALLRAAYIDAGMGLAEIGDSHGVTRQAVARWLDDAQIPRRTIVLLDPTEITRLYRTEQLACCTIGERVGVSGSTIRRFLHHHRVERRQPLAAATRPALEAALAQHMTAPQIADELGCSLNAICRALERENLETAGQRRRRQSRDRLANITTQPPDLTRRTLNAPA